MKNFFKYSISLLIIVAIVLSAVPFVSAADDTDLLYGRQALSKMSNGDLYVKAYDLIAECVENRSESVSLASLGLSESEFFTVLNTYIADPHMNFWLDPAYSYSVGSTGVSKYFPTYNYLAGSSEAEFEKNVAAFNTEVDKIIKKAGITPKMSEYEKEKRIHDVLALHIDYTFTANCYNAYGAIVEKKAVCQGYSLAFQYILRLCGIQAHSVYGYAGGNAHSWNLVRIDGNYYYTDLTWDDPVCEKFGNYTDIYYYYFNVTREVMSKDHVFDPTDYELPSCTSTEASFFTMESDRKISSSASADKIAPLFDKNGYGIIYLTDGNEEAFVNNFINNFYEIAEAIGFDTTQSISISYTSMNNEYHFVLYGTMIAPDYIEGDLNGDTNINAVDSNILRRIVAGTITPTEKQVLAADINGDGNIGSVDANLLMRIIAGNS